MRLKITTDLTGKKVGRLTVISFSGYQPVGSAGHLNAFWLCECECGGSKLVSARHLKTSATISCGCFRREVSIANGKRRHLLYGQSAANSVYYNYRYSAKKRGIQFALSFEEAMELFRSPCHYCGDLPTQVKSKDYGEFIYNGIDRRDNTIGYTTQNCVSCCGRCNYAKGKGDAKEFEAWINRAYLHLLKER